MSDSLCTLQFEITDIYRHRPDSLVAQYSRPVQVLQQDLKQRCANDARPSPTQCLNEEMFQNTGSSARCAWPHGGDGAKLGRWFLADSPALPHLRYVGSLDKGQGT